MEFNISKKAIEHADSCRFCWMCHHICPVGNATGLERNTARARGLAVSMVARGGTELTPDIVSNMYECCLCGGCTNVCVTGWDPILFTKQTRNFAAMNGLLPDYIEKMLDNDEKCGNIYGIKDISSKLKKEISLLKKSDTLLFLGMDARYKCADAAIDAINVLKKAKVDFTVIEDEPNSGYAFDTIIGAAAETQQKMTDCAKVLNKYKQVIVFDPADAKSFVREYKEYGVELKCKVITFTAKCAELIKNGALKPKMHKKKLCFQDPALLCREVGETEPARDILKKCGECVEMLNSKKDTMFAGNLIMSEYMGDVMVKMAQSRWIDAKNSGADALVTASCSEYAVLNKAKPDNMKLYSIEQLLLK